jgi:hypothetical protein
MNGKSIQFTRTIEWNGGSVSTISEDGENVRIFMWIENWNHAEAIHGLIEAGNVLIFNLQLEMQWIMH